MDQKRRTVYAELQTYARTACCDCIYSAMLFVCLLLMRPFCEVHVRHDSSASEDRKEIIRLKESAHG